MHPSLELDAQNDTLVLEDFVVAGNDTRHCDNKRCLGLDDNGSDHCLRLMA